MFVVEDVFACTSDAAEVARLPRARPVEVTFSRISTSCAKRSHSMRVTKFNFHALPVRASSHCLCEYQNDSLENHYVRTCVFSPRMLLTFDTAIPDIIRANKTGIKFSIKDLAFNIIVLSFDQPWPTSCRTLLIDNIAILDAI